MSKQETINLNFLTRTRLKDRKIGLEFLDLITSEFPFLSPERFGNVEPLRSKYDKRIAGRFDEMLQAWGQQVFIWKRLRPFAEGDVHFSRWPNVPHDWVAIRASIDLGTNDLVRFLTAVTERFNPDFATLHMMPEQEVSEILGDLEDGTSDPKLIFNNPRNGLHRNIITSHHLKKFIPNLYWATIFGRLYVDLFGRQTLITTPVQQVTELSNGSFYLQITESPLDFIQDYQTCNELRNIAKKHLNHNAFFDQSLPVDHNYQIPNFELKGQ